MVFWEKFNKKSSNFIIKKLINNKYKNFNFIEESFYNHVRDILAIVLTLVLSKKKKIKVLDYGGGEGVALQNLSNKINTKQIIFYVYDPFLDNNKILFEKKRVVAASGGEKVNCDYSSNLKSFKHVNFDLVYFGSSWQYLNNIKNIFNKINFSKKSYVLISHTPFSMSNSFRSKQTNHKSLIQNVHSYSGVRKFFAKNNFKIIFKSLLHPKYSKVQKIFLHKTIYLNILFKK